MNSVQDEVNGFHANGAVLMGMFVGSLFLACDKLLRMEELVVGTSANFINDFGFQVCKNVPGHMLLATVSLKKVLKDLPPPLRILELGIWPSGWLSCSRQCNFQKALPMWTSDWTTRVEMYSCMVSTG